MNKIERNIVELPNDADVGATPPWTAIHASLDRVIASEAFKNSNQLANFLRFVVEETLAGRSEHLKAYSIALDALGRDASFDPQNDPIVRVEAGRLRRALKSYYAGEGRDDPVVFELPRGTYVPVIRANGAQRGRRGGDSVRKLWRQAADALRENYKMVLMMAAVALVVSLTVEVVERTIWPKDENTAQISAPAVLSTGTIRRPAP